MEHAKKFISEIDEKLEPKSEIDKELEKIKSSFNEEYKDWSPGKQSGSSSKHGNLSTDSSPTRKSSKKGRPKANRVETSSELPDHLIHGFINEKLFLKNFLLKQKESEEFKTRAIVGKYGVGKTTLCQDVFNDEDVKQVYFPRIWVSMYSKETKDPKIDVVKRILRLLGVEDEMFEHIKTEAEEEKSIKDEAEEGGEETVKEKEELARLLYALHLHLIGKKYLIVLDDVWEDNEWDQRLDDEKQQEKSHLSCGFPKGFGGRVIITSRDERLAKEIVGEEENLQRLFPRSDAESLWKIYIEAVPTKVDDAAANAGDAAATNVGDAAATNAGDAAATNAGDAVAPKVNPRYPGRYKQELMDKSCGIPLAARMLAKIEPVKVDEIGNIDRKQSF